MTVHKKLGIILGNKVFQKLKKTNKQKTNFNQNFIPKLLFLIEKYQKDWDDLLTLIVKFLHFFDELSSTDSVIQFIIKVK